MRWKWFGIAVFGTQIDGNSRVEVENRRIILCFLFRHKANYTVKLWNSSHFGITNKYKGDRISHPTYTHSSDTCVFYSLSRASFGLNTSLIQPLGTLVSQPCRVCVCVRVSAYFYHDKWWENLRKRQKEWTTGLKCLRYNNATIYVIAQHL